MVFNGRRLTRTACCLPAGDDLRQESDHMCRQTHVVVELPMITLGAGGWRRSGSIRHP